MEIKNVPIGAVKAGPDDGLAEGEFIVYPSTFTKTPDSYGDVVAPGAFLDSLADWKASGNTLPGLYGHRMDDPDYNIAGATDTGEDEHGWWVKGKFDLDSPSPTSKARQVYNLVKGRRLNQLSFAYDTQDEGQIELADGTKANELRKLKVYEFSFVPVGANQDTSVVAVKSNAEVLVDGVKAGRTLSAKNEGDIRDAVTLLTGVLSTLESTPDEQDGKASDSPEAKAAAIEEPEGAKTATTEEPKSESSVAHWESVIALKQREVG